MPMVSLIEHIPNGLFYGAKQAGLYGDSMVISIKSNYVINLRMGVDHGTILM